MSVNIDEVCDNLESLDKHLADVSYVDGYSFSSRDSQVFNKIDSMRVTTTLFPNINRWYNHMRSFSHITKDLSMSSQPPADPTAKVVKVRGACVQCSASCMSRLVRVSITKRIFKCLGSITAQVSFVKGTRSKAACLL